MFSWVERVVPQPPGTSQKPKTDEAEMWEPSSAAQPTAAPEDPEASSGPPGEKSRCAEMPPSCKSPEETEIFLLSDPGRMAAFPVNSPAGWVLDWLMRSLGKVVPQPIHSLTPLRSVAPSGETGIDVPDQTEVQIIQEEEEEKEEVEEEGEENKELPASEVHIESTPSADNSSDAQDRGTGRKIVDWLVQRLDKMLPQPEPLKKPEEVRKSPEETAVVQGNFSRVLPLRGEADVCWERLTAIPGAPPLQETPPPPAQPTPPELIQPLTPESQSDSSSPSPPQGVDGVRVFRWLKQQLEMVIPQPVLRVKEEEEQLGAQAVDAAALCPGRSSK
ncbi:cyclic nucleotide-gated cation channel beta-1-like [Ornithorhynchus anatinus]|uniref:cyclic nucleotide-gated cation channel beta-1-like n=1 Tax=Ornithorhynchus anatinus TaxID=9258 RepID=UPI0019D4477F|nr:cyclic nucleotide-gated cation channel beta-1-like [Ornithorhynchus anatinus]